MYSLHSLIGELQINIYSHSSSSFAEFSLSSDKSYSCYSPSTSKPPAIFVTSPWGRFY